MATQLPTPSPSPLLTASTPTLPTEINTATRKQHVVLNRLIVERLPLALPPTVKDPELLGLGLAAFARIYFIFEDSWDTLSTTVRDWPYGNGTRDAQLRQWLAFLPPSGLPRSSRFKSDLHLISSRTGIPLGGGSYRQNKLLQRMHDDIDTKPHILLAYGWVMYMALFSGGRWIRQQLVAAGPELWTAQPGHAQYDKESAEPPGCSFLSFSGSEDGEDIKALFKARFAEAETLLTQAEREDVINAAKTLFEDCIALVCLLDRVIWWNRISSRLSLIMLCVVAFFIILQLHWNGNLEYFYRLYEAHVAL